MLEDPLITHVTKGTHPAIFYTLDLITELDPAFMEAYTAGATVVSVIRDDGPGALHLVLKGEKFRTQVLPSYSADFRENYSHWNGGSHCFSLTSTSSTWTICPMRPKLSKRPKKWVVRLTT